MAADPMYLEVLASAANQIEATAIINALEDRGIRASAVGAWTSGFQAEAPGDVKVMVARADLRRAANALVEVRREFAEFDWSGVDIREDEPPAEEEPPAAGAGAENRRLQFSIAAILIVQTAAAAALAFWRTVYVGSGSAVATFATVFTAMSAVMIVFTVAATVVTANDLSRGPRVAALIVLAEFAALAVICFVVLLLMALRV